MEHFLKALEKLKKPSTHSNPEEVDPLFCRYNKGWNDAIEKVEKLIMINSYSLSDAWIPVDVKLPKESDYGNSGNVIVTIKDTFYEEPMFYCGEDHLENGEWLNYNDSNVKVIAWQPFPEPYKEKKHE